MNINEPVFFDHQLTLDCPYQLMLHVISQKREKAVNPDIHYALHLGILIKGQVVGAIQDYVFEISPGQVWLTAPWEPHRVVSAEAGTELLLCTILLEKLGDIGSPGLGVPWITPFVLSPEMRPQMKDEKSRKTVVDFAKRLQDTMDGEQDAFKQCQDWLILHELLLFLNSQITLTSEQLKNQTHHFSRIRPVIEYMKKNPASVITVEEAAELCKLGKSRFCDLFKQTMGVTFGKYHVRARLSGAAAAIRLSQYSLKEIADQWGFYDESHFFRQFKQVFNCKPSEYKRLL